MTSPKFAPEKESLIAFILFIIVACALVIWMQIDLRASQWAEVVLTNQYK